MDLISLIGVAGGICVAIMAIAKCAKAARVYIITQILNHFDACQTCFKDVAAMKKKLDYELNANGGNSLKDEVKNFGKSLLQLQGVVLAILDSSDRGVWISDEKGLLVYSNEWFDKNLGWNTREMLGTGWKNVVAESERERVCREFSDSIRDGRDFLMEFSYIYRQDTSRTMRVNAVCHPIKRNSGEIIGFIGFSTELKS